MINTLALISRSDMKQRKNRKQLSERLKEIKYGKNAYRLV